MPDEYVAHYNGFSHAQLYSQLQAGNPEQLENLAAGWLSVSDSLYSVSTELGKALRQLQNSWVSDSGTEFANRVGPVSTMANDLSTDSSSFNRGFKLAASNLREAQKQAEDPAETDDNDSALGFAAVGTAVAGPVGGLVGAKLGHDRDVEQKEKAKARMVAVVAKLSGEYDLTVASSLNDETKVPANLPGHGDGKTTLGGGGSSHVSKPGSPVGGGLNGTGSREVNPSDVHGYADKTHGGDGNDSSTSSTGSVTGTGLTGGGGVGSTGSGSGSTSGFPGTLDGTSISDYDDSGTSLAGAGPTTGLTGTNGPTGGPSAFSAPGGGAGAAGLAGGGGGLGGGLIGNGPLGGGAGFNGGGSRGLGQTPNGTSLNSAGSGRAGGPGGAEGSRQGLTQAGNRSVAESRNAMGYRGNGDTAEDEADERSTWLTEDDMVWTGNDDVAPGVLGA